MVQDTNPVVRPNQLHVDRGRSAVLIVQEDALTCRTEEAVDGGGRAGAECPADGLGGAQFERRRHRGRRDQVEVVRARWARAGVEECERVGARGGQVIRARVPGATELLLKTVLLRGSVSVASIAPPPVKPRLLK